MSAWDRLCRFHGDDVGPVEASIGQPILGESGAFAQGSQCLAGCLRNILLFYRGHWLYMYQTTYVCYSRHTVGCNILSFSRRLCAGPGFNQNGPAKLRAIVLRLLSDATPNQSDAKCFLVMGSTKSVPNWCAMVTMGCKILVIF